MISLKIKDLPLKNVKESKYGKGTIRKKSKSCYLVYKSHTHYCSCRTYEQADFVKKELNKCNWDKTQLPRIFDEYPKYYTDLVSFYRYVTISRRDNLMWVLSIPPTKSDNGKLQHISHNHIEDALYERDFLIEHDWDYDLLVECIDDRKNPYYERVLPPYPERKIRNNLLKKSHRKELDEIIKVIRENPLMTQTKISELTGFSSVNIRNWLHDYNTDWNTFKDIVFSEDDPFDVLKLKETIIHPNLEKSKHKAYNSNVSKNSRSKNSPFKIVHKGVWYGSYPTEKLAKSIAMDLMEVDWDKSKLLEIQLKHGHVPFKSKNNIYKVGNKFTVRKYNKYYGFYKDYDFAVKVRDKLIESDWDESKLDIIVENLKKEVMGI